jgi:hypothetical protein
VNLRRCGLAGLLGGLVLMLATVTSSAQGPARADPGEPPVERQVLVMLRLAPPHFRSDADYGSGWDVQPGRRQRRLTAERIARDLHLRVGEDWSMTSLGVSCFLMTLPPAADLQAVVRSLERRPEVESVEPMHEYRGLDARPAAKTPERAGHQDPLFKLQPTASQWHLDELHAVATGRGITVAVIDSAVEVDHADLRTRIAVQRDFVAAGAAQAENHGTAVAGIIGARADNQLGIVGVAPGTRMLALRACQQVAEANAQPGTTCRSLALAKALQYAIEERADVINLSLTGPPDRLLARLIDVALSRGASVVAASREPAEGPSFPASHAGVVAVTSETFDAPSGAIKAPGRDIPTTLPPSRWGLVSGASFAAAQVSGLIAVLRELEGSGPHPRRWWSAHGEGETSKVGAGAVDACELARVAAQSCICSCPQPPAAAALSQAARS